MTDSTSDSGDTNCYDYPQYWDFAFSDETEFEADFLEAAAEKYSQIPVHRVYEPGCGGGRLAVEMVGRGYHVTACDSSASAIQFATDRLRDKASQADFVVADMTDFQPDEPVEMAFCMMNTIRHLLDESSAKRHLESVAASLKPGGLYVIGLHLLPPDADEEDSEEWSVEEDDLRVNVFLEVVEFSRLTRLEKVRFELNVRDATEAHTLETTYALRIYMADQMRGLLESVPTLELCDVFDFNYEIDEPLQLNDELGDTVLILRKPLT